MPTPPIQTLADWNARLALCGCCAMPECPAPELVCEAITVEGCGFALPVIDEDTPPIEDRCTLYKTRTDSTNESASESLDTTVGLGSAATNTTSYTRIDTTVTEYFMDEEGMCSLRRVSTSHDFSYSTRTVTTVSGVVWEDQAGSETSSSSLTSDCTGSFSFTDNLDPENSSSGEYNSCPVIGHSPGVGWSYSGSSYTKTEPLTDPDGTRTLSVVYSDPVTPEMLAGELATKTWEDDAEPGACAASRVTPPGCPDAVSSLTKARFRFQIPSSHTGSYFKIEADTVFYPDGWDEEGGTPPTIVSEHSVEWNGPGSGGDDDPSWLTDWIEIEAPESAGTIEVRNIAFTCYRPTLYGAKPQFTGETFIPVE
jgi:hypothetical protein